MEALWLLAQAILVNSWIPGSAHRIWLLRRFGAKIGRAVVLKPHLRVKFPWRLTLGDYVWLGESVWIDNLANVEIGSNVCVSQGVYLCTGSHDWGSANFNLIVDPILVADHVWICASSRICPGTRVGEGAVITLGSVAAGDLAPWHVYAGAPARAVRLRKLVTCEQYPSR